MTPAQTAWNTYMQETYVNNKGETKPTYASKWRKSNPNRHQQIVAYKNGTGPRPNIPDGYGPMIVSVVDIIRAESPVDPPPPTGKRYAPRTHNLGGRDQDPRFCCKPEYGVVDKGSYFEDEMGCRYSKEPYGLSADGRRDREFIVPGLKGADSMDGAEPCDPYAANGISVPPYPGDPIAQTGSYHR